MPKLVIEIESPTETTAGAILEGHYTNQDGKVRVIDAAGRPVGSEEVAPGNDPAVIARRILCISRNSIGQLMPG